VIFEVQNAQKSKFSGPHRRNLLGELTLAYSPRDLYYRG